jgi:type VI secretion system protein ImpA
MASPALLPFEDLILPVPGENPAGDSVPFTVRQKLEEHRKEVNPNNFAEDDPARPPEAKYADWPAIVEMAQEILKETSKDLLVAARLTEALTKEHGFAGLRDGLHLLRRLVEEGWDRIIPSIEDGDLEVRAGPFNWLDDPDRGARFPTTVRSVPLVFRGEEPLSWMSWRQVQDGRGNLTADQFDQAINLAPRQQCQAIFDDLAAARAELQALGESLNSRMEDNAPSLMGLQKAVSECEQLAEHILARKGPADDETPAEAETAADGPAVAAAGAAKGTDAASAPARSMRNRADVYRQLSEAANLLQQIEPHSPIPYLIQRACQLGAMPFPQLMRALIRDENILSELNRELGIKEPEPEPEAEG